jgi:hypothetical protein
MFEVMYDDSIGRYMTAPVSVKDKKDHEKTQGPRG